MTYYNEFDPYPAAWLEVAAEFVKSFMEALENK